MEKPIILEARLFDIIPSTDFLQLQDGTAHTSNSKALLEVATVYDCEFVIPTLILPHVQPLFTINEATRKIVPGQYLPP